MATREIKIEDESRDENKRKYCLRAEYYADFSSKQFGNNNASVVTKSSQNKHNDCDVLLTQDFFGTCFTFYYLTR